MKYSLRSNHWEFDFAASSIFALGMSTAAQIFGDSGGIYLDHILAANGVALGCYVAAYLLSIVVRKRTTAVTSWIWMAIAGAVCYGAVTTLLSIRNWFDYVQRFPQASDPAWIVYGRLVIAGLFLSLVLGLTGAIFLVGARIVGGFIRAWPEDNLR